jgi:hypothetical protein
VDLVPDPLLLRKCGSAGNRTRDLWICKQEVCPLDHLEILDADNNNKRCLKDVACESVDLIYVAQDKEKCWDIEHNNDFSFFLRNGKFIQKLSHLSRPPCSKGLGSTIIAVSQPI